MRYTLLSRFQHIRQSSTSVLHPDFLTLPTGNKHDVSMEMTEEEDWSCNIFSVSVISFLICCIDACGVFLRFMITLKKSNICEIWKNWANIGVFMFVKWFIIIGCICIKGNSDQHIIFFKHLPYETLVVCRIMIWLLCCAKHIRFSKRSTMDSL